MHELLWAVLHAAAQLAPCMASAAFLEPDEHGHHVWDLAGVSTARVMGAMLLRSLQHVHVQRRGPARRAGQHGTSLTWC